MMNANVAFRSHLMQQFASAARNQKRPPLAMASNISSEKSRTLHSHHHCSQQQSSQQQSSQQPTQPQQQGPNSFTDQRQQQQQHPHSRRVTTASLQDGASPGGPQSIRQLSTLQVVQDLEGNVDPHGPIGTEGTLMGSVGDDGDLGTTTSAAAVAAADDADDDTQDSMALNNNGSVDNVSSNEQYDQESMKGNVTTNQPKEQEDGSSHRTTKGTLSEIQHRSSQDPIRHSTPYTKSKSLFSPAFQSFLLHGTISPWTTPTLPTPPPTPMWAAPFGTPRSALLEAMDRAILCGSTHPSLTLQSMVQPSESIHELANVVYDFQLTVKKCNTAVAERKRQRWNSIPAYLVALLRNQPNQLKVNQSYQDNDNNNDDDDEGDSKYQRSNDSTNETAASPYDELPFVPPQTEQQLQDVSSHDVVVVVEMLSPDLIACWTFRVLRCFHGLPLQRSQECLYPHKCHLCLFWLYCCW